MSWRVRVGRCCVGVNELLKEADAMKDNKM